MLRLLTQIHFVEYCYFLAIIMKLVDVCCLIAVLALVAPVQGVIKIGMTEFVTDTYPFFTDFTPDGKCGVSFECDIVFEICKELGEECVVVPLPDFDARLSSLENKEVNFTISIISVNPERAERVHFIRPYYYYAGAVVFHLEGTPVEEQYGWEDLTGKKICIDSGYYAADAIIFSYGPEFVFVNGNNASQLSSGLCDAAIADNTGVIAGLMASTKTLPEFGAPYGIAVSQDDRDTLGAAISDVLVNIMSNGTDSLILQFEQTRLVEAGGYAPSKKLADLVTVITRAGELVLPAVEDAIWDE
eukprot:TRINITY_DN514_c0_g1_i6.p1 TRINITY_DN514_c0_g1~~TRINITY_DN514_c0_g1_i6.p1  ORF type:complete len:302 (+),score=71.94 TRINITY_DN514_c0_g1_i6:239-1144(+)